jgi:hypothetical protein
MEGTMDDVRKASLVRGKTIRFTWTDGPTKGETHEHVFHDDGSVEYARIDAAKPKGSYTKEKQYAAVRVGDDVYLVSYLAASGLHAHRRPELPRPLPRRLRLERQAMVPVHRNLRGHRLDIVSPDAAPAATIRDPPRAATAARVSIHSSRRGPAS